MIKLSKDIYSWKQQNLWRCSRQRRG